jgi:hypothetical protein
VKIGQELRWEVRLRESWLTGLMNLAARVMPDAWWQRKSTLKGMGAAARFVLKNRK